MNGRILYYNGLIVCIAAIYLTVRQAYLFGGNIIPQSTPEAICDLVCTMWILVGIVLVVVGHAIERK